MEKFTVLAVALVLFTCGCLSGTQETAPTTTLKAIGAVGEGTQTTQKETSTTVESTRITEASGESGIEFTTDPDKDTYLLSDTFEPKVEVAPLNPEHNYTIVIFMHADGGSPSGGTDTQSMTGVEYTTVWLHPFTNDQTGYSSENEHFTTPGVHHFEISVYDCTVIEASTGVENCARGKKVGIMEKWEFPDALKNQQPDGKIDKAITVVGVGTLPPLEEGVGAESEASGVS
jgi:hypothetical protein